jgi:hypothetical protein
MRKQSRFAVAQRVQFQFVVGRDLPQLRNVERRKARAAGDQNGFCGLAGSKFVFLVLPHGEVVRAFLFQLLEHQIDRVFKFLVILADFRSVDEFQKRREVLFLDRGFIMDVADQRHIQQRFGLHPEVVPGLSLALGVGDQRGDELQNVFFRVDIRERIVVHGFLEVDRVEDFDFIALPEQQSAAFDHYAAFEILSRT